ncbi:ribonuclease HI family protein [Patescibacteria group bacterium]|nr:ribonuclease HI family protein [Candidatus Falkowbacteria bacterium]MBU3905792.1 ribonuclease HI family protein [Patescibacteria group bacterium]MCG2697670.1 ribonuclease HI family protein [Candidatus Parcubacteria bacterium]MBU4015413.1 ribonuclease HI family protein [Patescibacteria group bacterium]MBU4025987.1 ribonuclease HI family protein [Patescibacteria group bacterium]
MSYNKLIIYTDGGARGNPGPAGIGAVIYDEQKNIVAEISEYIGETTNNQAEYKAVIAAIEKAKKLGAQELDFYLDSELVVRQLNREYKVKNNGLAPLFVQVYNAVLSFKKVSFSHIRREMNKEADRLVNLAIDAKTNSRK